MLRVNGARPVLLQGSAGGNFRATIQLTNPTIDRNIESKVNPLDDLVRAKDRDRARPDAVARRVSKSGSPWRTTPEHPETVTMELELGIDGADIFEVRGLVRDRRGTLHPAAVLPARATFRYDGLDGRRRSTYLRFSGPADEIEPVEAPRDGSESGAWLRLRWTLAPRARAAT